jgi:hypothetical protein
MVDLSHIEGECHATESDFHYRHRSGGPASGWLALPGRGGDRPCRHGQGAAASKASPRECNQCQRARSTAISAKYEIEHGALQLSVYTMKGDRFSELILDHTSGAVANDQWITDADDLKAAQAQAAALAKAKTTLDVAAENAVKANPGYRAISIVPKLEGSRPIALVILMKGDDVKKATEKLD